MLSEQTPYILQMLNRIDAEEEELPPNRGQFITELLDTAFDQHGVDQEERDELLRALSSVANNLKTVDDASDDSEEIVRLIERNSACVEKLLPDGRLEAVKQLGILHEATGISFSHPLLKDYFLAKYLTASSPDYVLPGIQIRPWHPDNWWKGSCWDGAAMMLPGVYDDPLKEMRWIIKQNPVIAYDALIQSQIAIDENTKDLFLRVICSKIEGAFLNNRKYNLNQALRRMANILEELDLIERAKARLYSIVDRQVAPLFQPTLRKLLDSNLMEWRHEASLFWQGYGMTNYSFDPDEWVEFDPATRQNKVMLLVEIEPALGSGEQELFRVEYGDQLTIITSTLSATRGLIYALTFLPDYILTDILMASEILGTDMIQYLKQFSETSQIPYSFITAQSKKAFAKRYSDKWIEEAQAWIQKPFDSEDLLRTVGDHLGLTPLPPEWWKDKAD